MPEAQNLENQKVIETPPKKEVFSIVKLIEADPANEQHRTALQRMDRESSDVDGMLNATSGEHIPHTDTQFYDWISCKIGRKLWLIKDQEDRFIGFVYHYDDEHSEWVREQGKLKEDDTVAELSSFVLDEFRKEGSDDQENQAMFLAIQSMFSSGEHEVDTVTVYVTHDDQNILDPKDTVFAAQFGFQNISSLRYPKDDTVDSTCFLLRKEDFMSKAYLAMVQASTPLRTPPVTSK